MIMVGQVPGRTFWGGYPESPSLSEASDDVDVISEPSTYRTTPTPGPVLKEVVDMFTDGDKVLEGKRQ